MMRGKGSLGYPVNIHACENILVTSLCKHSENALSVKFIRNIPLYIKSLQLIWLTFQPTHKQNVDIYTRDSTWFHLVDGTHLA